MTDIELLEWCYKNQNENKPGTTTVVFEELNVDSNRIKQQLGKLHQSGYIVKPFHADSFSFVEFTKYGLEYCRNWLD